jgi:hypothetical protein
MSGSPRAAFGHWFAKNIIGKPATQETIQTMPCKCTSRPDCPCEFCISLRAKHAEGRSEKDKENQLAEDFLRSYSRKK